MTKPSFIISKVKGSSWILFAQRGVAEWSVPLKHLLGLRRILVIPSNALQSNAIWSKFPARPRKSGPASGTGIHSDPHCWETAPWLLKAVPSWGTLQTEWFLIAAIFWRLGNSLRNTGRLLFLYALSVQYVFNSRIF